MAAGEIDVLGKLVNRTNGKLIDATQSFHTRKDRSVQELLDELDSKIGSIPVPPKEKNKGKTTLSRLPDDASDDDVYSVFADNNSDPDNDVWSTESYLYDGEMRLPGTYFVRANNSWVATSIVPDFSMVLKAKEPDDTIFVPISLQSSVWNTRSGYYNGIPLATLRCYKLNENEVYEEHREGSTYSSSSSSTLYVPYARYYHEGNDTIYEGGALTADDYRKLIELSNSNINLDDYYNKTLIDGFIQNIESKIPNTSNFLTKTEASTTYQPKGNYLTEHQQIKTINNENIIGTGNIKIPVAKEWHGFTGGVDKANNSYVTILTWTHTPSSYNEWSFSVQLIGLHNMYHGDIVIRVYGTDQNSTELSTPTIVCVSRPESSIETVLPKARIYKLSDTQYALAVYKSSAYGYLDCKLLNSSGTYITTVTNGTAYSTSESYITQYVGNTLATQNWVDQQGYLTSIPSTYAKKTDIPTKVSAFENDANYAKKSDLPELDNLLSKQEASSTYQLKGDYLNKSTADTYYQAIGDYINTATADVRYVKTSGGSEIRTNNQIVFTLNTLVNEPIDIEYKMGTRLGLLRVDPSRNPRPIWVDANGTEHQLLFADEVEEILIEFRRNDDGTYVGYQLTGKTVGASLVYTTSGVRKCYKFSFSNNTGKEDFTISASLGRDNETNSYNMIMSQEQFGNMLRFTTARLEANSEEDIMELKQYECGLYRSIYIRIR